MTGMGSHKYTERRNIQIPLPDGTQLAANGYFPDSLGKHPVIISYYPYHKDDVIGCMFDYVRQYFASHGFIDLIIDFRGTGGSTGYCWDTFDVEREGRDGAAAVEWAGAQEWSNGSVGFWGMSYGGMTSLNVATHQPPHLKACLSLYGTPNIYKDLIFPGGIPNALGNSVRETYMLAMDMLPPTLQDSRGRWRDLWSQHLARLDAGDLWSLSWVDHQSYDEHWQSRTADLSKIKTPTFMIGGWNDIFPDGMTMAFEGINAEKKLVMGPWVHQMPHDSPVAPWDWLPEAVGWWKKWLSDEDSVEIDITPPVRLFMQSEESWVGCGQWPASSQAVTLHLDQGWVLAESPSAEVTSARYVADLTFGTRGLLLDPMGTGLGFPLEQSSDVAKAASYLSEPAPEALRIAGNPQARLAVTLLEGEDLDLCVKLVDMSPEGKATHIATGWLNGEYRSDPSKAVPVEPGIEYVYPVDLWATGYTLAEGHRLGVLVACTDFPHSFAPGTRPTISIRQGGKDGSCIVVPLLGKHATPVSLAVPTEERSPKSELSLVNASPHWRIEEDLSRGSDDDASISVSYGAEYEFALPGGSSLDFFYQGTAHSNNGRPDGMRVVASAGATTRLGTGELVRVLANSVSTRNSMILSGLVEMDGVVVFEKSWSNTGWSRSL
jgi:hypothetical protein